MANKIKYFIIESSKFKLDGGAMFGIIPKPLWQSHYPSDDKNRIPLALRMLLIQTNSKNILIDTGIGDHHDPKFNKIFDINHIKTNFNHILNEINLTVEDITDLVLSHLHFDHVGGIFNNNQLTFPNATCHLHSKHLDYSLKPTLRDQGSFHQNIFLPAIHEFKKKNKLNLIDNNNGLILSDQDYTLKFKCSHGHTPFMIHPYDQSIIYMADLIPTSSHIPIPWVMSFDINPGVTVYEKEEFLKFSKQENLTVIFEHDIEVIGGKVSLEKGKYKLINPLITTMNEQKKCLQQIKC